MNDADVLGQVRESVSEVRMHTSIETIMARGRARRRHRISGLAAAGGVVGVAAAVGLTGVLSSGSTPSSPGEHGVQLAAFTIVDGPGGASTLTLRKGRKYRLDPDALRRALAQHDLPALVTVGRTCASVPAPITGLDQVVSSHRQADGSVDTTFDPHALPSGTKLGIGYFPTGTTFTLITDGAPLRCTTTLGR